MANILETTWITSQISPQSTLATFPTHRDLFGFGGLKVVENINNVGSINDTKSWIPLYRRQTGSIIFDKASGAYYRDNGGVGTGSGVYTILPALTTGSPTFPGLTSSAGILITNGANISFSAGGNIATTGTASFGGITSSVLSSNYLPVANSTKGLVNSAIQDNGSLITLGRATYVSGNFQANGTVSATTGLSSSGYLVIGGNTQLGKAATNTTSVFGTLSIVNAGSNSGSIICDSSGNLVLDGSGISSGVQITDGILWLGASGSTGIQVSSGSYGGTSYYGGMISSSMKIVALNGFANRTSDGAASFEVDTNGNLECYSLKETSLRQYKHEIHYITESQLLNISKLKPITFLYNQDVPQDVNDTRLRQAGFIAEQVQQIYPEVAWYKDGKLAGLQYQRLTAYLTRGIQQLVQQNKKLSHRLDLKDKAITKLNKRVTQLQTLMNTVLEKIG